MHGNQACPCRESVGWESESQKSPRVKSAGNCVWGEETLSYVYTISAGDTGYYAAGDTSYQIRRIKGIV